MRILFFSVLLFYRKLCCFQHGQQVHATPCWSEQLLVGPLSCIQPWNFVRQSASTEKYAPFSSLFGPDTVADSSPLAEPANDLNVVKRDSLPSSSSFGKLNWRGLNGETSEASGSIEMKSRIRLLGLNLAIWSAVSP
jgi:hypothetical protein